MNIFKYIVREWIELVGIAILNIYLSHKCLTEPKINTYAI